VFVLLPKDKIGRLEPAGTEVMRILDRVLVRNR
jgi:hypothetical protein